VGKKYLRATKNKEKEKKNIMYGERPIKVSHPRISP
jgi:hypothetical protein